ncbi:MAG: hypothetical protein WA941_23490 [Nitrososphaeraceae archaeon]
MYWLGLIIVFIVVFYFWFLKKQGNLDFWKTAKKNADEAYELFGSEDCWVIFSEKPEDGYHKNLPEGEWDGPFLHQVPKSRKLITVFGKVPDYYESQKRFMEKFNK